MDTYHGSGGTWEMMMLQAALKFNRCCVEPTQSTLPSKCPKEACTMSVFRVFIKKSNSIRFEFVWLGSLRVDFHLHGFRQRVGCHFDNDGVKPSHRKCRVHDGSRYKFTSYGKWCPHEYNEMQIHSNIGLGTARVTFTFARTELRSASSGA